MTLMLNLPDPTLHFYQALDYNLSHALTVWNFHLKLDIYLWEGVGGVVNVSFFPPENKSTVRTDTVLCTAVSPAPNT